MLIPRRVGELETMSAALPVEPLLGFAFFAALRVEISSAYRALAATGKRSPVVRAPIEPMRSSGSLPYWFAYRSTSSTYQVAWLYAKIAPRRSVSPPAAFRYRAAAQIASTGLYGSLRPSPLASAPYACQVEGMNCIHPRAPAEDTLRLVPNAVSILLIEARTCQGMPYSVPQA